MIAPAASAARALEIAFTGPAAHEPGALRLEATWLAGAPTEALFDAVTPAGVEHGIRLFRSAHLLLGCVEIPFTAPALVRSTQELYERILQVTAGWHLYRIWNYVPAINAVSAGLEHYRAFCQGRSRAFEQTLGPAFPERLPAASAVGTDGRNIAVVFAAGRAVPEHIENPEQVPAYRYPPEHGPRPPSFARATLARDGERAWAFISGTAAIKGHQTVAPGTFAAQLECTLDNLRLVARAAGLPAGWRAAPRTTRHFKVYLRHARDLATARRVLERELLAPEDVVTYLRADICRAALNVEIEATLRSG